ncbi:MAG: alkaline phosphatase [Deltaproteobacteria bacterium]|nr:alkaline phosphatase [Deltaproteobacteria bacterium]
MFITSVSVQPCTSNFRKFIVSLFILVSLFSLFWIYFFFLNPLRPKNIIVMIGDGMGPQQISLAMQYAKQAPGSAIQDATLNLERLMQEGELGLMGTYIHQNLVTDSAGSATQLATGAWTRAEMVGLDHEGNRRETVLEKAKRHGKAVGFVTNTRMTHATPAGFYAHQRHRSLENEIALDLLELKPDVAFAGGLRHFLPKNLDMGNEKIPLMLVSKRKDDRNLIQEFRNAGYDILYSRQALETFSASHHAKVLGFFDVSNLPYVIDTRVYQQDSNFPYPSLKEMSLKALEVLSKNKHGFVLMIEGGLIDYAGHYNDTGMMLHELLAFDEAIGGVMDWISGRRDTLLIVTADHETGGFGLSYSKNNVPPPKALSGDAMKNAWYAPKFNFGNPEVLDRIFKQKKSFEKILEEFEALAKMEQKPQALQKLTNENCEFKISLEDAQNILKTEPNTFFIKDHEYLGDPEMPKIHDFKEFYVYGFENRCNLMGRAMAKEQQVVWGTGTHTSTLVPIMSYGPSKISKKFSGYIHSTKVGQTLLDLID